MQLVWNNFLIQHYRHCPNVDVSYERIFSSSVAILIDGIWWEMEKFRLFHIDYPGKNREKQRINGLSCVYWLAIFFTLYLLHGTHTWYKSSHTNVLWRHNNECIFDVFSFFYLCPFTRLPIPKATLNVLQMFSESNLHTTNNVVDRIIQPFSLISYSNIHLKSKPLVFLHTIYKYTRCTFKMLSIELLNNKYTILSFAYNTIALCVCVYCMNDGLNQYK